MEKNLPAMQKTWVQSLGWEDPLEKGMATHSSILAWKIHGQRSLVGYSPWGYREFGLTGQLSLFQLCTSELYLPFLIPKMKVMITSPQKSCYEDQKKMVCETLEQGLDRQ